MGSIKLNDSVRMDLGKLIESRLLVQANSGGGKSWAIRRIIEQSFGKVQIIVLDPEGEFTNLREQYDFVFAGKDGDAPAEPRSAALLARRLLEVKASAIVDLYELNPQDRKRFVRLFCEALVNAPKELWQDCLIIIDEAHVFAPEKGESEAMGSVIDLATRGRKRGYCLVLATQRFSKLNKDAAAECNNKLVGRASQDIDMKRAADDLGFTTKEQTLSLRLLKPGEFYAFGPAISDEVRMMKIGDVNVKPPPRGVAKRVPPPPTEKVKALLAQLSDLPKQAEEEARTVSELKAENMGLKRQVSSHRCPQGATPEEIRAEAEKMTVKAKAQIEKAFDDEIRRFKKKVMSMQETVAKISRLVPQLSSIIAEIAGGADVHVEMPVVSFSSANVTKERVTPATSYINRPIKERAALGNSVDGGISGPEQRILNAIAWMESIGVGSPEATAVAFLAGYTYGGGGFNNPKGSLRSRGLIEYRGSQLALTEEGRALAQQPDGTFSNEALHEKVLSILPGPERRLLEPLISAYPESMGNEELAQASGYTAGSGGFNNPKGRLRTLNLVEYPEGGRVKASSVLFPI